jgi:hypothetical protein
VSVRYVLVRRRLHGGFSSEFFLLCLVGWRGGMALPNYTLAVLLVYGTRISAAGGGRGAYAPQSTARSVLEGASNGGNVGAGGGSALTKTIVDAQGKVGGTSNANTCAGGGGGFGGVGGNGTSTTGGTGGNGSEINGFTGGSSSVVSAGGGGGGTVTGGGAGSGGVAGRTTGIGNLGVNPGAGGGGTAGVFNGGAGAAGVVVVRFKV